MSCRAELVSVDLKSTRDDLSVGSTGCLCAGSAVGLCCGRSENCVHNVALSYSDSEFHGLLDVCLHFPAERPDDAARRRKPTASHDVVFQARPQIALDLIGRAKAN